MRIIQSLGKITLFTLLPYILYATPTLKLELSKSEVYVGESLKATMILQYSQEDKIINQDFDEFIADDFWIKELNNKNKKLYEFIITPQKEGKFTIQKQLLKVANREEKTNFTKWNELYTNEAFVNVKALPTNINIQGNFSIEAIIDKKEVKVDKPLNLKIKIKGYGNFEDIQGFDIKLEEQLVYKTEPSYKTTYTNNKNQGELSQSFSILSNTDYEIPIITFSYFNRNEQKIKTIKTKAYKIKVLNTQSSQIKSENISSNISSNMLYVFLLIGIIIGIISTLITYKISQYRKNIIKKQSLYIKVKNAKTDQVLYDLLLPYSNKIQLVEIIKKLEANLYKKEKKKINKKEVLEILLNTQLFHS